MLVKVVAVGHDHDGTLRELLNQPMYVEHHRQRLAATLSVPEHANLASTANGFACLYNSLVYGKVLVICCHNLCRAPVLMVEAQEVLQYVDEPLPAEDALKECFIVNDLC